MELAEAIAVLGDGHSVLTVQGAQEICQVIGVPFPEHLVFGWKSAKQALNTYGFLPYQDGPGTGVNALDLSFYVASEVGVGAPGRGYTGRGFRAQANSRAIAEKLLTS